MINFVVQQKNKKMKKLFTLILLTGILSVSTIQAQQLLKPFESISHKKTTYITLKDGTEISGTVKSLDRKKGLIEEVKMKDADGKKKIVAVKDIKHAYFPQSGWDQLSKGLDFASDATQWDSGLYDAERLKDGYAYFETCEVMVKKKKMTLLMQLLNPHASERVKLYHDPFSKETMGVGVAGVKLAGGIDKSYYASKDGAVAFKFEKKNYKEGFKKFIGDCKAVATKYSEAKWNEFVEAVFLYNGDDCGK